MVPVPGLLGSGAYPGLVFTITTWGMAPRMVLPAFVTWLGTATAM